jgi:hypothetical protein
MRQKKITQRNMYQGGQVMITLVIFFLFASATIVFGIINPILKQVALGQKLFYSKGSYYLASSSLEDAYYRFKTNKSISPTEILSLNNGTTTTTIMELAGNKQVISLASVNENVRKIRSVIIPNAVGASFHYGIQSGQGGFVLYNSSSITGNLYTSGDVVGHSNNIIYGDIVASGSWGLVYGIHATGTVYSNSIGSSFADTIIDKDAHYQNLYTPSTTVSGTLYPNSPDQPDIPYPISDAQIADWEAAAALGGTLSGCPTQYGVPYIISSSVTLGPIKIPCDVLIRGNTTVVTVAGPVWITGNITTQNGPTIQMDASLGNFSVPIISDRADGENTTSSNFITIGQNTSFQGSGFPGSYVFMISQNNACDLGSFVDAISINQSSSALIAYAIHGGVELAQSTNLKEVVACRVTLRNTANITYSTGLPSMLFESGPSGGYIVVEWGEM